MESREFQFENIAYIVRFNEKSGHWEYRDKAHIGGPWSDAERTIHNHSIKFSFRRKLIETCK